MSDLIKVLSCVRKAKEPITADEVAADTGIKRKACVTYLCRLALSERVRRAGTEKRDLGRPAVLYETHHKNCC
jgi:predicted ArsR family transcriptional regulator